jgi:hypothetical protein
MKRAIITAIAAGAFLVPAFTSPLAARGKAWGTQKVCLVTFSADTGNTGADADIVSAELLPLPAAMNRERQNDELMDIYSYGANGYQGAGVDYYVAAPDDAALGITPDMNTAQVCSALGG